MEQKLHKSRGFSIVTPLLTAAAALLWLTVGTAWSDPASVAAPPVTAQSTPTQIVMDNGILSVTVDKHGAKMSSIIYRHDGVSTSMGFPKDAMYFDTNGGAFGLPAAVAAKAPKAGYAQLGGVVKSIVLTENTPDEAETVLTTAPTMYLPFRAEIHYILKRGVSGFYVYVIYSHGPGMSAGSIGQSRFVIRGPSKPNLYNYVAIDDARFGPVDESPFVKAVSDATFLQKDGNVYCKYNNTAFMADHHLHGMLGNGVGIWMINPSDEYVNGGPIKQELTVHQVNILLNMLQGGHFGGGSILVKADEPWTKFYGPFLVYLNSGPTPQAMYADAKQKTTAEVASWPYQWVNDPNYAVVRGSVQGTLHLTDGESAAGAWVVLADPGGDWPMQAKHYEFWTRAADDGSFTINKVCPGSYALYAYGANQFEQLEKDGVTVAPGATSDLGVIDWQPVTHGTTLWQIGTPDRTTLEYRGGQDNWGPDGMRHWANFMTYQQNFPNDVNFTIGKSDPATDWNYAQWTWYSKVPYWTVNFTLPAQQQGTATLTFGVAAADPLVDDVRQALGSKPIVGKGTPLTADKNTTHVIVKVNGTQVGELNLVKSGAAAYRSGGEDSLYQLKYLTFPANLLTAGQNQVTFGDTAATPFPSKAEQMRGHVGAVMYDSIRLEVAPTTVNQ